jgi:hypothetical protein
MSIVYEIYPDLNLVLYICTGTVTPIGFFLVGDKVALDPRLKAEMKIIIDFFHADLETTLSDLKLAIQKKKESEKAGKSIGQTAILTRSSALAHFGDALRLISQDSVNNFAIFHTDMDVIRWLSLPEEDTLARWTGLRGNTGKLVPDA